MNNEERGESRRLPNDIGEQNFLDHYFSAVYSKLDADALLFNRKLPHGGLVGAENENALAALLREFLPPHVGVEVSGIVIDRHGGESRQCDIILYDAASFPRYFRKVFPVELVYGTIEVKTTLTSASAKQARENLASVAALDFRTALTPYWITKTREQTLPPPPPPFGAIFAYRSEVAAFETFAAWFPFEMVLDGFPLRQTETWPEIRTALICCLDKGTIGLGSTNLHVQRWMAATRDDSRDRILSATFAGMPVAIDPAKSLFLFLEKLWQSLWRHRLHPGFDIRSYMSRTMDEVVDASSVAEMPLSWYMKPT